VLLTREAQKWKTLLLNRRLRAFKVKINFRIVISILCEYSVLSVPPWFFIALRLYSFSKGKNYAPHHRGTENTE
jgi:hypothetical protein